MLKPSERTLYTEVLVPPDGYRLDFAVATTYSMDLTTLLSVPLHLVLHSAEDYRDLMRDPVALYESVQRAASRVMVFAQRGAIHAPQGDHLLFGMLESMIIEVEAPGGGVFHPKMWLLRFEHEDSGEALYRLLISSRNITTDRSWDMSVTLEGVPGTSRESSNNPLAKFVSTLPSLAASGTPKNLEALTAVAAELKRVEWECPPGYEHIRFHVLGLGGKSWKPPANDVLAVISPFVSAEALKKLAATSANPLALVSRSSELAGLPDLDAFETTYVMHDAAETDEGEETTDSAIEIGLHAKVYVYEVGRRQHLVIGSANATNAALLAGRNVELMVELEGPRRTGRVRELVETGEDGGFGSLLMPWSAEDQLEVDPKGKEIERVLEKAKTLLLGDSLCLECVRQGEAWALELTPGKAPEIGHLDTARVWPVTLGRGSAVDCSGLSSGRVVSIQVHALASLTGLLAFELALGGQKIAFVLNLPVKNLPKDREQAVLRHVVSNREGFLRYLLLLLAGLGDGADIGSVARVFSAHKGSASAHFEDDMPLLEELVRAFSRDPERLIKVKRLVEGLREQKGEDKILPDGFLAFWQVFEEALDGTIA
jgi:hypothetical protein